MEDSQTAGCDGCCSLCSIHTAACCLTSDQTDIFVINKIIKSSDGIGAAAYAGQDNIRKSALFFQHLLFDLLGNNCLEITDNSRERVGSHNRSQVFNEKEDEIKDFIGENGYFSSMFDFEETCYGKSANGWYASKPYLSPEEYKKCIFHTQKKIGDTGMISNIIENHDEPRGVCHYISPEDRCPDSKKLLAGIYFLLKGIPFIYQGQEIGMENMEFTSMDQIDDISTIDEYQVALRAGCSEKEALDAASAFSRDNARTPVQWSAEKNAGFTEGEPWLGVNPNYKEINVETQLTDSDSLLSFYKKLTALRKAPEYKETLVYGTFTPYQEERKNLIAYTRNGEKDLLILGNMQAQSQKVSLSGEMKKVLLNNQETAEITGKEIILKPYQFIVLEIAD